MKNFISISLIALILLSGCKSNSFMTQRYTKFGHSSRKNSQSEIVKVERNQAKVKITEVAVPTNKTEETSALAMNVIQQSYVSNTGQHSRSVSPSKKITDPLFRLGNKAVSLVKKEIQKSEAQKVTAKKTFKEKFNRAAGIFNTALKIVLFAVVLAILVAIIIIIVLT